MTGNLAFSVNGVEILCHYFKMITNIKFYLKTKLSLTVQDKDLDFTFLLCLAKL